MKKIGVAVIGLGVGEQLARTFHVHDHCELLWVNDLDSTKSRRISRELETKEAENLEQILNDPKVDLVTVATYDDVHVDQVVPSLESGRHVFCEKPLCVNRKQLIDIKEAWERQDGKVELFSNLILRTAPIYRWLRDAINKGEFGKLFAADGDYLYGRLHKIIDGWRGNRKNYSAMLGGGIHLIDLLLWLVGNRPQSVCAYGNNIATQSYDLDLKDFVASIMEFENGLIARVSSNLACVHKHQHFLRIFGSEKTFILDDMGPRVYDSRDQNREPHLLEIPSLPASKGELIFDFVDAIINDKDISPWTQQVFDGISIGLAVDESLNSGEKIMVEYI
jgi:predicted dehydrogenase